MKKLVFFHYPGLDNDSAIIEDCKKSGFNGTIHLAKDMEIIEI